MAHSQIKGIRSILVLLLTGAMSTGAFAGVDDVGQHHVIVLKCELSNSAPRSGGQLPDPPFTWRFRVDLTARTVDGVRATITDTEIGWHGRQMPARPYATLSRPGWQFHSAREFGRVHNEMSGLCVEQD